jgi:tyrosine-protein phosphatase SIW14
LSLWYGHMMLAHGKLVRFISLHLILAACLMDMQACSTLNRRDETISHGIPNLVTVGPGIYRGGQPDSEGWAYLKALGVKTVIKLNYEYEGSDQEAADLDMTVIDASMPPSNYTDFYQAPPAEKICLALQSLQDESRRPVYVHCLHGQDRTGLVVGIYRVLHDHYTREEAYREMLDNNFHPWFRGLSETWENFDGRNLPE